MRLRLRLWLLISACVLVCIHVWGFALFRLLVSLFESWSACVVSLLVEFNAFHINLGCAVYSINLLVFLWWPVFLPVLPVLPVILEQFYLWNCLIVFDVWPCIFSIVDCISLGQLVSLFLGLESWAVHVLARLGFHFFWVTGPWRQVWTARIIFGRFWGGTRERRFQASLGLMFTQVRSRSVILKLAMIRLKLDVQLLFFFLKFSDSHIYFTDLVIQLLSAVQLNLFLLEIS